MLLKGVVNLKGTNHWKIPEIISYVPSRNTKKCPDIIIKKNIFGKPIQGRKERVIAQLIQVFIEERISSGQSLLNFRWLEILRLKEILFGDEIKTGILTRWKQNKYSKELKEE